jgi:hypothetical protein
VEVDLRKSYYIAENPLASKRNQFARRDLILMIRIRLGLHLKPRKTISKSEEENDLTAQDRNGL